MVAALPRIQMPPRLRHHLVTSWHGFWSGTKKSCVWFVPMFLTASSTAYLSYFYNQKSNAELAVQQQTFSDIQAFRNSGADVDQSLGNLSDALVDGKGIDEAKSRMRNSVSRHISDALADENELGSSSKQYIKSLAQLRQTVDSVSRNNIDADSMLWEQSLKLMSQRRRLIVAAQQATAKQ